MTNERTRTMTTQQPVTNIAKGRGGWRALSVVPLDAPRFLRIETYKGGRGIQTWAIVAKDEGDGTGWSFVIFQDYNKMIRQYPGVKCTEKNVTTCHLDALDALPAVLDEVRAFYAEASHEPR
jgi:hypothetical protein